MKNKLLQMMAALAIAFVLFPANVLFAQTAKRIEFAKDSSATVKDAGSQSYIFRAGGEKTIKIRLVSKGNQATFNLLDAEGSDFSEGSNGRSLEMMTGVAGDYQINVHAAKDMAFTLIVTVK